MAWNALDELLMGPLAPFNTAMQDLDRENPQALPDLGGCPRLGIFTDYSGEHSGGGFHVYGLLVMDWQGRRPWQDACGEVREKLLEDRGEMAFKKLNDGVRYRALGPFLGAADKIPGLLLLVAVDKSLLGNWPVLRQSIPIGGVWKPDIAEKAYRIAVLMAVCIAGLSSEGQEVLWLTDDDDTVANKAQREGLIQLVQRCANPFLPHQLGGLGMETSRIDDGSIGIHDLLAIPDLFAGGYSEYLTAMSKQRLTPGMAELVPAPESLSEKTRGIVGWFSDPIVHPLRRLVLMVDRSGEGEIRLSRMRTFVGAR